MNEEPIVSAKPQRRLKWAFVGSHGLRSGWRAFVFFAMIMVMLFVVTTVITVAVLGIALHYYGPEAVKSALVSIKHGAKSGSFGSPEILGVAEFLQFIAAVLATIAMALFERRSLSRYGLGLRGLVPRFLQGLITGIIMLSGLIGILWWLGGVAIDGIALQNTSALIAGAKWGVIFLLVGAGEELVMRGYILQTFARHLNFRWAAILSSAIFMLGHVHNGGENAGGLASVFLVGLVFAFSIWRTGTIWWAVGYHAAWDWSQTFMFGVADSGIKSTAALLKSHPIGPDWLSGGVVGPEGSALMPAVLIATAAIIFVTLKRRDQQLDAQW